MAHEYSSSSPFEKHLSATDRYHHQPHPQPLQLQWPQNLCGQLPYPQAPWPQTTYSNQGQPINSFSTPADYPESSQRTILSPSPQIHEYDTDLSRSMSRSPGYYTKPWLNGVIHSSFPPSSVSASSIASSPPQSFLSRPASAAPMAQSAPILFSFPHPAPLHAPSGLPPSSPPSPSPSPPRRKFKVEFTEEDECGFVMDPSSYSTPEVPGHLLGPPMKVPLRATQASEEMRSMMGVYRLDPFAMHHGGEGKRGGTARSPSSSSCSSGSSCPSPLEAEAHPLMQEPLIHEFQVNLDHPDMLMASELGQGSYDDGMHVNKKSANGRDGRSPPYSAASPPLPPFSMTNEADNLHSFPPEFELRRESMVDDGDDRDSSRASASAPDWSGPTYPVSRGPNAPSWDADNTEASPYQDFDAASEANSSQSGGQSSPGHHTPTRLHSTVSHPYIRKSSKPAQQHHAQPLQNPYPHPSPSPPHPSHRGPNILEYQHHIPRHPNDNIQSPFAQTSPQLYLLSSPSHHHHQHQEFRSDMSTRMGGPQLRQRSPFVSPTPQAVSSMLMHPHPRNMSVDGSLLYTNHPHFAPIDHPHHAASSSGSSSGSCSALHSRRQESATVHRRWSLPETSVNSEPCVGQVGAATNYAHGIGGVQMGAQPPPFLM